MSDAEPRAGEDLEGAPWWLGLAAGAVVFGFGVAGLLRNRLQTRPGDWLKYALGSIVVHDALLAPVVLVTGFALVRLAPRALRGGLQATLAVAAVVALMSIPVVRADGRRADNPSLLPSDYGRNLVIVLAVIVAAGALLTLVRARRAAHR